VEAASDSVRVLRQRLGQVQAIPQLPPSGNEDGQWTVTRRQKPLQLWLCFETSSPPGTCSGYRAQALWP
jgi:hypothetical protein